MTEQTGCQDPDTHQQVDMLSKQSSVQSPPHFEVLHIVFLQLLFLQRNKVSLSLSLTHTHTHTHTHAEPSFSIHRGLVPEPATGTKIGRCSRRTADPRYPRGPLFQIQGFNQPRNVRDRSSY